MYEKVETKIPKKNANYFLLSACHHHHQELHTYIIILDANPDSHGRIPPFRVFFFLSIVVQSSVHMYVFNMHLQVQYVVPVEIKNKKDEKIAAPRFFKMKYVHTCSGAHFLVNIFSSLSFSTFCSFFFAAAYLD